ERLLGIEDDAVIGDLRDGATRRDRQKSGATPAANPRVHLVVMEEGAAAAAPSREPVGSHLHDRVEIGAGEIAKRPRPSHEGEELVFLIITTRRLSDDLLRQDVDWTLVRDNAVELAPARRSQERRTFDQVVT